MIMGSSWCNIFTVHLFLLLLVYVPCFFSFVRPLCHVDEGTALLQLKESFTILHKSAHPKLSSWTAPEGYKNLSCCSWIGVECDEESGHVIGLDLSSNYLHGSISSNSSLFRLVHLQRLDLSDNDFGLSDIPSRLGHDLRSLVYLNLSYSSFGGNFPAAIFHLPNLQVLDLDSNQDLNGSFPDTFNRSSPLEYLNVGKTRFSGFLPGSIGNLPSLYFLNIAFCEFFPRLPFSLGNLTQLNYLDISFFFDRSFTHLETSPANFSLLNTNSGPWLGKLAKLYHLGLGHTYLRGEFPPFVANLTKLAHLNLDYNQITDQIPSWLMNFTQLTHLSLRSNNLQGEIPGSLFHLHNLEYLDLSSNNMTGSVDFDSTFSKLNKLRVLQLSSNMLSLRMIKSGSRDTGPKFEVLQLGSCNLTEFPEFLKNNSGLVDLDLSENHIEGEVPKWFWSTTRNTLLYLRLSRNSLTGFDQNPILFPWRNLLAFELGFNRLQGSLPTPPPTVKIYSVPNNNYSGQVSVSFCNLKSLFILDLSGNNLAGLLPQCLGNSGDALKILNLRNNSFHGEIPPICTNTFSLRSVDLSRNLLHGKLPRSLGNCTRLEFLSFGSNQISDTFPSWLGDLPVLRILSLPSNRFHGTIKKHATNPEFLKLCFIDLSNNGFSGMLPSDYMEYWDCLKSTESYPDAYIFDEHTVYDEHTNSSVQNALSVGVYYQYNYSRIMHGIGNINSRQGNVWFTKVLDLSSNRFEGKIPDTIGNFRGLLLLNLSNNILTGNIPSSIGYFTYLEVLDLSRNQLSGGIPSALTQLTFLVVFNVSYNHLRGRVPMGAQLSTFDYSSFEGNSGLCGMQLSDICEDDSETSKPSSNEEDQHSAFHIQWYMFLPGLVTGLVAGLVTGNILTTKKHEWFVKTFSRRKPKWKRGYKT